MDPVAVVIASSFSAFSGSGLLAHIAPSSRRKVEYGTGIVVSASGYTLTTRHFAEACSAMVASGYGDADRVSDEPAAALALLRLYGAPALPAAAFSPEGPKQPELTLVGIADPQVQEGGLAVSSVPVRLKSDVLEPVPPPGFDGAAALDAHGQLVGMVELKTPAAASAGTSAAPRATLVAASAIRAFLDTQRLPMPPVGAAASTKDSLVRLICVRR